MRQLFCLMFRREMHIYENFYNKMEKLQKRGKHGIVSAEMKIFAMEIILAEMKILPGLMA